MIIEKEKLKPCPFCGGEVQLETAESRAGTLYGVVCRNTGNRGCTCAMEQVPSRSAEAAIDRWNLRKPMDALLAEIERLEVVAQHEIEIATERAKEVCGARMTLHALTGERDQLKAENEALRKDAERYRWLRDGCGVVEYKAIAGSIGPGMLPSGDKLQSSIDALMAASPEHQDS